jgi:hypothetical protein
MTSVVGARGVALGDPADVRVPEAALDGECTSQGRSENLWWCRWWAAHQRTPFWPEVSARKARMNWKTRLVLKVRCEK